MSQFVSERLQTKQLCNSNVDQVISEIRTVVLFPEEGTYTVLNERMTKRFMRYNIGDVISLTQDNRTFATKIIFRGSEKECNKKCIDLENDLRKKGAESSYHGSEDDSDDESIVNEPPTKVSRLTEEINKEKLRLKQTLPGANVSALINQRDPFQETTDRRHQPIYTSTPPASEKRSSRPKIEEKQDTDLLKLILEECRKTNVLLQELVNKGDNSTVGQVSNDPADKLNRGDYVLDDGTNLLDVPRVPHKYLKYARNLAKKLWTDEELLNGIIEPQKQSKTGKITLDVRKVGLLKGIAIILKIINHWRYLISLGLIETKEVNNGLHSIIIYIFFLFLIKCF
ncbi:uncharacterized protein LOC130630208 isoform X1 [Hydractinia symbiolongicarpus]|uniref:uncharacterized protein LOC130630208 isoform X1 n=1 Tax=Hydractinia symbiolongicarpus TaxID=13093 RepID=UPI002550E73D|nr:uncharacterized protein LOC130630208 isoform X1 [Hydractinia symbiolongicarpus]